MNFLGRVVSFTLPCFFNFQITFRFFINILTILFFCNRSVDNHMEVFVCYFKMFCPDHFLKVGWVAVLIRDLNFANLWVNVFHFSIAKRTNYEGL